MREPPTTTANRVTRHDPIRPIRSRPARRVLLVLAAALVVLVALAASAVGAPPAAEVAHAASTVQGRVCLPDTSPASLDHLFDSEPAGVIGADYQRAHPLPDGRVLWLFQDGVVRLEPDRFTTVHNIGMLQDGACFAVLYNGTRAAPEPFLFVEHTAPFFRWFWPLDAEMGSDGRLYIFVAEMREESGDGYLKRTVPVSTGVAAFDPSTSQVVWMGAPADESAALYGWSVTSDERWTYLYANCYRQFGFDAYFGVPAFDAACAPRVTVARVPRGQLLDRPSYWDGATWQPDPARAVPVIDTRGRRVNADQIEWTGSSFFSVNKEGDWWGDTIYLSRAEQATGPFVVYDTIHPPVKCLVCNNFFATWIPGEAVARPPATFVYALSHNAWDGLPSPYYRPTFHAVTAPPFLAGGRTLEVQVAGGVGAGAAVLNVAAVRPADRGYLTAYPCDRPPPLASNVNHAAGQVVGNMAIARPDARGRVCLFTLATADLVVDQAGTFLAGSTYQPLDEPTRIADTRTTGRLAAGQVLEVAVPGGAGARAAALNVTAVGPSAPGYVTAFPCDRTPPLASNLNYRPGDVVPNLVIVRPDAAGTVCLYTLAATDLVVDLAGTFPAASAFTPLDNPTRVVDTRATGRLAAGQVLEVAVPGAAGADAVALNVTAVGPSGPGFLTVYPCDRALPTVANLNYGPGQVIPNMAIARPDAGGRVCVYTLAATDVVVDLAGVLPAGSGYQPIDDPTRILDTRDRTGTPR